MNEGTLTWMGLHPWWDDKLKCELIHFFLVLQLTYRSDEKKNYAALHFLDYKVHKNVFWNEMCLTKLKIFASGTVKAVLVFPQNLRNLQMRLVNVSNAWRYRRACTADPQNHSQGWKGCLKVISWTFLLRGGLTWLSNQWSWISVGPRFQGKSISCL